MQLSPHSSIARATQRAYNRDFNRFAKWCKSVGRRALRATPRTVVLFLCHLAKTSRLREAAPQLSAVKTAHDWNGLTAPARNNFLVAHMWQHTASIRLAISQCLNRGSYQCSAFGRHAVVLFREINLAAYWRRGWACHSVPVGAPCAVAV